MYNKNKRVEVRPREGQSSTRFYIDLLAHVRC